ncbi:MAG: type II secretion system F family protein [Culicoidibacterales bacterium]
MFAWLKKWSKYSRKQITYELEQLFILRQGFEQGYAIQESLQCMSAFAKNVTWERISELAAQGASIQVLLTELHFRNKTLSWLCGTGEGSDLDQAVEKTVQLLQWELHIRTQLQKTFAYPLVMLGLLLLFGTGFSLFILPQLQFLQISGTVILFALPEIIGGSCLLLVASWGISYGVWSRISFSRKMRVWRYMQRARFCQIWSCLRLALHCQLGLLQGKTLIEIFAKNHERSFFAHQLASMHDELHQGIALNQVMEHHGFNDQTWLSFFQWQPTNQQILIASEFYWQHAFRQLQQTAEKWCQIGQTICFLIIGGILLQFYLALFLPIFEITTQF